MNTAFDILTAAVVIAGSGFDAEPVKANALAIKDGQWELKFG